MASGVRIHFDTTELKHLEIDLKNAPRRVRSPQGLRRAAKEIEREMRVDAKGHEGNWFGKPGTQYVIPTPIVSHELTGPLSAEIGIESGHKKGTPGASGGVFHLLAYGGPKNEPAYDPGAGPRRAMTRVLNELADHAEESTLGRRGKS